MKGTTDMSGLGGPPIGNLPASTSRAASQYAPWKSNANPPLPHESQRRNPNHTNDHRSIPRPAGSRGARLRRAACIRLAAEAVQQRVERRIEQHEEERREDQEDQGEEDLHRRLVRALLGHLAAAR